MLDPPLAHRVARLRRVGQRDELDRAGEGFVWRQRPLGATQLTLPLSGKTPLCCTQTQVFWA